MGGKVYTIVKYYLGKGERLCNIDPDKYSYMDFIEDIKDLHGVSNNNIKIRCELNKWASAVVPNIVKELNNIKEESNICQLSVAGDLKFEVQDQNVNYIVNLKGKARNCMVWYISGIPYKHVALGIAHRREDIKSYTDNRFSTAKDIVSDRDNVFTNHFWKELFNLTGVSLDMSFAYHPQTDGQTERVNQCLEIYLRCMCHQHPRKWSQWISLAEFWFNATFHSGFKATSFEALYGYPPNQLPIGPYLHSHHSDVEELMKNKVEILQLLKENLQNAQQRMKIYADKKRTEREFEVGDEEEFNASVSYFGPYKVVEWIGNVAYKLALPLELKIHPIFHVSLLKKKIGSKYMPSINLSELEDEVYKVYPLAILAWRLIPRNNVGVPQVLIHWSHSFPEQVTWEDYYSMVAKFPPF
ncbi:uncharacterized protein LOC105168653 [Sesamum indicum]|uniref:Uncharacterized protein LOC105168653 n=1 Tax=Sesamum indicum TaxID=4182 RepID=A0A6I9TMG6_SESIN|nr:uncharacterized protein LOC105168653 [Sesamum indicum]